MSRVIAREDIEGRYLAVLRSLRDASARPAIPHDSALESALETEAAMAHHFDVQWGHTRFARAVLPGAAVLDAGCGAGDLSLLLGLGGARRVIALDFQPGCADFAQWLLRDLGHMDSVEVRCGDAGSLQLASGELDAIFSIEAISHYRDPDAFLDMAAHALRPGGFLFISDGNNGASAAVRSANQEVWDLFEQQDEPAVLHGHVKKQGSYRSVRLHLIGDAFPGLSSERAQRYSEWTFGMSQTEIQSAVPMFEVGDFSMRRERSNGSCPKDPLTDCAMERLFDPRTLARAIAQRGFSCRVVSNGPARRDLAFARAAWESLSPLTILTSRGFSLVCRRDDD